METWETSDNNGNYFKNFGNILEYWGTDNYYFALSTQLFQYSFQIRGSFYLLMGALCQSNQALANDYADKICPLVLHNLDESDPAVCPALWEAALYTISTIEVMGDS